jgi:hypothetical protein
LPVRRTRPDLPATSTKKPSGLRGTASSDSLRLERGRREIAGVELVQQQHVHVLLLDGPLGRRRPAAADRDGHPVRAELHRAHVELVEVQPLRRNPALEAEDTQLRVGSVVVDEPREQPRHDRLEPRVVGLDEHVLERRLVRGNEPLAELLQCEPQALGELRRGLDVLDVLLGELAAVRAERRIEELDGGDAVQVGTLARALHPVEGAHHVLLAADHVERGQLA